MIDPTKMIDATEPSDGGYVVENAVEESGKRIGTARVYVRTEAKAQQLADAAAGRSYRRITYDEMPEKVRIPMMRARGQNAE